LARAKPQAWRSKVETSTLAYALDKAIDGIRREGSAPFCREDESRVRKLPAKLAQRPNLIAAQRVN
jgi:hypothetical protein